MQLTLENTEWFKQIMIQLFNVCTLFCGSLGLCKTFSFTIAVLFHDGLEGSNIIPTIWLSF